ncbi:MAG: hypothetical protein ABIR91_04905 [Candidatus Saccharimonadales bacterium]
MILKRLRKRIRIMKRQLRSRRFVAVYALAVVVSAGSIGYAITMPNHLLSVNPATYQPLLTLVARAESADNYNAYFGNPVNQSVKFTSMTVDQVLQWQKSHVDQGSPSDAVGRYQIISPTLSSLITQLNIDPSETFSPSLQDKLAIALLERRGATHYVNKKLTQQQFAANLAQEWAALPKIIGNNPSDSYYAGDGLNTALVSIDEILHAIEPIAAN